MITQTHTFHIVLADDHALLRETIKAIIATSEDLQVFGEAKDGLALRRLLERCETMPEMIILDISMPHMDGLEATRMVKRNWPDIKILILTVHKEKDLVDQAFAAGAKGYMLKEDAARHILTAIDTIRRGGVYLPSFYRTEMPA